MSAFKFAALATLIAGATALSFGVEAKVPESQAARLGQDLTPIGAEKGGNADGTIPAWTGGLSAPPPNVNYQVGMHHPDPFASEQRLFTITPANMAEHADKLTGTHKALLDIYGSSYFMPVYPTHRTCTFPESVFAAARNNATVGTLAEGGNGVKGAIMSKPFPIPNNALEIIWNHMLPFINYKATRQFAAAIPTASGDYTLYTVQDEAIVAWNDPSKEKAEDLNNIWALYIAHTVAPARRAGNVTLVHETINMAEQARLAWQYSPGTRRVRRAPDIAYDNPGVNSDGMTTVDSFGGYNGSPDRYNWTVIGKDEFYLPNNNYRLGSDELTYDQIVTPRHINQEYTRYELQRAWVIEANLKPATRHVYARRRMYLQEDSWGIVATELYDTRGELWRVQEGFPKTAYEVPLCAGSGMAYYDLTNARYLVGGLINEEPAVNFFATELREDRYTPAAIRRLGVR
ncbi:MAG: DUF1329 domain-containing protein [Parvibaculaceae bacterium]